MGPQQRGTSVVGGPGGKGGPQGLFGQVLEVQHSHLGVGRDPPAYALQVTAVGGQGVGRRLGGPRLEQPALDELAEPGGGGESSTGWRLAPCRSLP